MGIPDLNDEINLISPDEVTYEYIMVWICINCLYCTDINTLAQYAMNIKPGSKCNPFNEISNISQVSGFYSKNHAVKKNKNMANESISMFTRSADSL